MEPEPFPPSLDNIQLNIKAGPSSPVIRAKGASGPWVPSRYNQTLKAVIVQKLARLQREKPPVMLILWRAGHCWSRLVTAVRCQPLGGLEFTQDSSWSVNGAGTLSLLFSIYNSLEKQAKQCCFVFEQQWGAFHCTVQLSRAGAWNLGLWNHYLAPLISAFTKSDFVVLKMDHFVALSTL